jgi:MFS family permease
LVIAGQAIAGFGMGLNMANLTTWLAHEANPEVRGRANGVFVTLMFLGQFVTSLVFTPIVTRTNYNFGFFLSSIILLGTGFVGLLMKKFFSQS